MKVKLQKNGYTDIEFKGIEEANGEIKSITVTATDAVGVFKQLNFERAKLQGAGEAQFGLLQTVDASCFKAKICDLTLLSSSLLPIDTRSINCYASQQDSVKCRNWRL